MQPVVRRMLQDGDDGSVLWASTKLIWRNAESLILPVMDKLFRGFAYAQWS